jgi:hypothetical protein
MFLEPLESAYNAFKVFDFQFPVRQRSLVPDKCCKEILGQYNRMIADSGFFHCRYDIALKIGDVLFQNQPSLQ